MRQRRKTPLL
jgi:hypothetical protein